MTSKIDEETGKRYRIDKRAFVEYYFKHDDTTGAAEAAGCAERSARTRGNQLLHDPEVLQLMEAADPDGRIRKLLRKRFKRKSTKHKTNEIVTAGVSFHVPPRDIIESSVDDPKLAKRLERKYFWSAMMRDESMPPLARLKASELLGKVEGDFVERVEVKHNTAEMLTPILTAARERLSKQQAIIDHATQRPINH